MARTVEKTADLRTIADSLGIIARRADEAVGKLENAELEEMLANKMSGVSDAVKLLRLWSVGFLSDCEIAIEADELGIRTDAAVNKERNDRRKKTARRT